MKKNMSSSDSAIRIITAIVLIIICQANIINGSLAITLLIVAGILILTAVVLVCPLYSILGIRTCKSLE